MDLPENWLIKTSTLTDEEFNVLIKKSGIKTTLRRSYWGYVGKQGKEDFIDDYVPTTFTLITYDEWLMALYPEDFPSVTTDYWISVSYLSPDEYWHVMKELGLGTNFDKGFWNYIGVSSTLGLNGSSNYTDSPNAATPIITYTEWLVKYSSKSNDLLGLNKYRGDKPIFDREQINKQISNINSNNHGKDAQITGTIINIPTKTATISRGERPTGSGVCGRTSQTAITSRSLSNEACIGS